VNDCESALRGPAVSRGLGRCGIDARRYWLLVDLFSTISDRGEVMDQLGRNGVALRTAAALYALMSLLFSVVSVLAHSRPSTHLGLFLFLTAFLFLAVMLLEAGNSLVNPVEGLVLAHQPIPGATYTAAKLSHLLRIVLWLTPALNGIPAIAGLALPGARWFYPLLHLGAGFGVGLLVALLVCAAFGWLMRFVPAKRLKAVAQFAGAVPFAGMMWMGQVERAVRRIPWHSIVPADPAARWTAAAAGIAATVLVVALGIRSLSADYLIRVSAMMRGGTRAGAKRTRSWGGAATARLGGGQGGRAGFLFVSRLMLRDWQFRRQFLATGTPILVGAGAVLVKGYSVDPFGAGFSPIHFMPHAIGMLFLFTGSLLPFGSDYKGGWVFPLAPPASLDGFAAGVYGVLAEIAIALHAIVAPLLVWKWGVAHAALFLVFSLTASAAYVAGAMRLIDEIPFTRQPDPKRGALTLPVLLVSMLIVGIAVGAQHFLLFRSAAAVAIATVVLGAAAWPAGGAGIRALAEAMRCGVAETARESGTLYHEVEA
jgi:hypothetical protein